MAILLYNSRKWLKTASFAVLAYFVFIVLLTGNVFAIALGYTTQDDGVQAGMVVSLTTDGSGDQVERASQETSTRVIGIITTFDSSVVSVSSGDAKILVENTGQVDSYVSDINGEFKKGDLLILSPLKGILMRASEGNTSKVIAVATQSFTDVESSTYQYQDIDKQSDTKISKIKVDLSLQGGANSGISANDSTLKNIGKSIVGKEVSDLRVFISILAFIIVLVAESAILYGAISSAITALGRNPLARKVIRQELFRVIMVAITVLLIGLGAVYSILWV